MLISNKNTMKSYIIGLLLIPIICVFYVINSYTFLQSDDWAMRYNVLGDKQYIETYHYASPEKVETIGDVFSMASRMYMEWGGGFVTYLEQGVFCGMIDSKLPFDIINTCVFLFFTLLVYLVSKKIAIKQYTITSLVIFVLLFWFLAPVPNQILYWVVGRSYLWGVVCLLAYLLVYFMTVHKNFAWWQKIILFLFVLLLGHIGLIGPVSVCGALVIWYSFNIKEFKGNAIPLTLGYGIGTLTNILAPGNFERLQVDAVGTSSITLMTIVKTFFSYKVLYLLLFVIVLMWLFRKEELKKFCKKNVLFLLALFWSVIAFSVVFRPSTRACVTTEVLSLLLLVSICNDYLNQKWKIGIIAVLFAVFIWDSLAAIEEAKGQWSRNLAVHQEIMNSDGNVCFDNIPHEHRMVLPICFESWAYPGMISEYGLDSLYFHPLAYCEISSDNDQCINSNYRSDIHENAYECKSSIILKFPIQQYNSQSLTCKVEYCKRKNISRELRKKLGLYRYEHYTTIRLSKPDFTMNGFDYYIVPPITNNYGDYISAVQILN